MSKHARTIPWMVVGLAACFGDEPVESDSAAVHGGEPTCERPEVGKLDVVGGFCTGTLVSPTTVLTGAHCYDWESGPTSGSFTIEQCDGTRIVYETDHEVSLPYSITPPFGHSDIAIARLTTPVPPDVATPASIATWGPYPTERMTIYGYGCEDWDENGSGVKRRKTFRWGLPHWLSCVGDSGGPIFDSLDEISLLTSWGAPSKWLPVDDAYANPVRHRRRILEEIAALEGR